MTNLDAVIKKDRLGQAENNAEHQGIVLALSLQTLR